MSRAFVNEDAGGGGARGKRFALPSRDEPGFDEAAARVLLDAAVEQETEAAEEATGYRWGDPRLEPHVSAILARAEADGDELLAAAARRYLR